MLHPVSNNGCSGRVAVRLPVPSPAVEIPTLVEQPEYYNLCFPHMVQEPKRVDQEFTNIGIGALGNHTTTLTQPVEGRRRIKDPIKEPNGVPYRVFSNKLDP